MRIAHGMAAMSLVACAQAYGAAEELAPYASVDDTTPGTAPQMEGAAKVEPAVHRTLDAAATDAPENDDDDDDGATPADAAKGKSNDAGSFDNVCGKQFPFEIESNDDAATANAFGLGVCGTVTAGDVDVFAFETSGTYLNLATFSPSVEMHVFAPDGTKQSRVGAGSVNVAVDGGGPVRIEIRTTAPGPSTYFVYR